MKRILSFLLRVVFIVIVCLAVNNFSGIIDSFKWKNLIKEDKPSQVQVKNFEAITKEKCFYYFIIISNILTLRINNYFFYFRYIHHYYCKNRAKLVTYL